jgi:hypothetical protein
MAGKHCPDHHLARTLHPQRLKVELACCLGIDAPQAAVKITDWCTEEQPTDEGQERIANIAVKWWHRAGLNTAPEAVTNHEICPTTQSFYERVQRREVVTLISVPHDDVSATCCLHATD